MGNLTKNFSSGEFECHGKDCCGHSAPLPARNLLIGLQLLRDKLGVPLTVIRGFSCNTHNARIPGAAKDSQHPRGTAADVSAEGYTPKEIASVAATIAFFRDGGIGTYRDKTSTHLDVRHDGPARWSG